jgi:hypothetical protein
MHNRGFIVVAQNSENIDYVRQAYVLAMSIKKTQPTYNKFSIVTNDVIPEEYISAFDKIIPIPFRDHAESSQWKIENRWKVYHASPYHETIVLDSDMLVLDDIEYLWDFAKDRDLFFTSHVKDFRGERVLKDTFYRKMFVENNLPNIYTGLYYFKKSEMSSLFFNVLKFITFNWQRCYYEVAPESSQKFYSVDVSAAIAVMLMGIEDQVVNKNSRFTFTHLKPGIQNWEPIPETSLDNLLVSTSSGLWLNNFKQTGILHYIDDAFLTDKVIEYVG